MVKRSFTVAILIALLAVVATVPAALGRHRHHTVRARLSGYNEVISAGGAVSTTARGTFRADIDEDARVIHYRLSYQDLVADVTQAHIHFGQRHTTGGITAWLCQTTGTQAPEAVRMTTPFCPIPEGTVEGTITAAEVIGPAGQGIAAGEFAELVRAIRAGATYANVHSAGAFASGELRGQITGNDDGDDHDRDDDDHDDDD
jgi:CHRD domain